MRALVTRPRADADDLARALERRGFAVLIEPMLEIAPRGGVAIPLDDVQGFLATSANGARALAVNTARRDLPLWAVGEATAAEARRLGFAQVEAAGGDVSALAALVAARADPARGALVHAAGTHLAGDLAGQLARHGFAVRRVVLYATRPAQHVSPALRDGLTMGAIDAALFFSPRTAATFVRLARAAGLDAACAATRAYALSAAVADALDALVWRAIRIADRPNQEALLASIDADVAPGHAAT